MGVVIGAVVNVAQLTLEDTLHTIPNQYIASGVVSGTVGYRALLLILNKLCCKRTNQNLAKGTKHVLGRIVQSWYLAVKSAFYYLCSTIRTVQSSRSLVSTCGANERLTAQLFWDFSNLD